MTGTAAEASQLGSTDRRRAATSERIEKSTDPVVAIRNRMSQVIRGKDDVLHDFLIAVLAGGSILLEDLPGVGKTTLAKTFAGLVDLSFNRLQCTPDLLPSDVYGFSVYNTTEGSFNFRPGPVFCNILLVDEINRASPRTQSALLEAMAERQVTIEGQQRSLREPFLVIATQNPLGFQGTYPLPEAQLDRFLLHLTIDYPGRDDEIDLLYDQVNSAEEPVEPLLDAEGLIALQRQACSVGVHRDLGEYLVRIVELTRQSEEVLIGVSPRGSQMLFRAAQAAAFLAGRQQVRPDDIQAVAPMVLAHRLVLRQRSGRQAFAARHSDKRDLVVELVKQVPVPV